MLINEPFYHSVSNLEVSQKTTIDITKRDEGLHFTFICENNLYTQYNEFKVNNQPLWQQEVLEVFISFGSEISSNYIEFQINPNNAIFLAEVYNPCLSGKENTLKYIDPNLHSINPQTIIDIEHNLWKGEFTLPFSLIGGYPFNYRINIFRIIAEQKPLTAEWKGSQETCTYACWRSTPGLIKPSFHQPKNFTTVQF